MMLAMSAVTVQSGKRRWRPWKVLLLTLVAIIASFACYQWYLQRMVSTRLQTAIEATDESDSRWRWAEMVEDYEKLPASPHITKLLVPWRGYRGWFGDDIIDRPGAIPYERDGKHFHVRFPEPYFKILQERLLVPEATGLKVIREELKLLAQEPDLSKMPFDDLDLVQRARFTSNYLLDEMELVAHQGNGEALIPLLQSQLRLSRYCMATPKPIMHLVGMALGRQGGSGIKRALSLGTLSPSLLLQFQKLLEMEDQSHLIHILRSVRAEQFEDMEQAKHDPVRRQKLRDMHLNPYTLPSSSTILQRFNYWWKWLEVESSMNSLSLAQAEILECSNGAIALAKTKPQALTRYFPEKLNTVKHLIARQFIQVGTKLTSAEMSTNAELRALIVALACERYRLAHGTWPTSLKDLQPDYLKEIPIDPYTGKEMIYRLLPDSVVIYSVGHDLTDNGGEVLDSPAGRRDRGVKLFNFEERGKKYEEVEKEKAGSE